MQSVKREFIEESSRIKDECETKLARLDDIEDRERQVSDREAEIVQKKRESGSNQIACFAMLSLCH